MTNIFVKPYRQALSGLDALMAPSDRTIYLSFFRVFLAFHILKRELFQWPFLKLLYDGSTFAVWSRTLFGFYPPDTVYNHYLVWHIGYVFLTCLMAFGIGKRGTVFAVYVVTYIIQETEGYTLDGGDIFLRFLLLYMCVCDSFHFLSLSKITYKTDVGKSINALITRLGVACILIQLSIVYCSSGIAKMNATVWQNGTAMYYIMMNDRFCGTHWNVWLVQSKWFVTLATYGVMCWETTFPFFAFLKKTRIYCLSIGVLFHAGIYLFMMINSFAILFVFTYGVFFTDDQWIAFWKIVKSKAIWVDKYEKYRPTSRATV